jgi:uncharacterized protein (DUF2235 family)
VDIEKNTKSKFNFFRISLQTLICIPLVAFIVGCSTISGTEEEVEEVPVVVHALKGDSNKKKDIFVFLDGTKNTKESLTNVWRLFDFLREDNDPQTTAIYIEGVGSVNDAPFSGATLGRGMEPRILRGYRFISENYNPSDNIYLFGFSRGAHQARSLAGLISYAGVLKASDSDSDQLKKKSNQIIELVKKKSDEDYLDKWSSWHKDQLPLLYAEIKSKLNIETQTAEVAFLGVWDTVPGSLLKNYGVCKEEKKFVKKYLYWLIPGIDKGERYKTDSYPPINQIAHAVSRDEKRSKFAPLLLCREIDSQHSSIIEVWFPGSHSDVGGGYEDSRELPSISLEWMIGLLNKTYRFNAVPHLKANAKGLAHWSIGDRPGNIGSKCVDRKPPKNANIHSSVEERKRASPVSIRWEGIQREDIDYPITCSNL